MKNKLIKGLALGGVAALALAASGCQSCVNDIKARGGLIGSHAGDYVAISQSGGEIMDVYKLKGVYVESIQNSDGWRFTDQGDNVVSLGGDAKLIRLDDQNKKLWDKYCEYHMEFEKETYKVKYGGKLVDGKLKCD